MQQSVNSSLQPEGSGQNSSESRTGGGIRRVLVLAACLVATFVCGGLCYSPRGLFTASICEDLGFTRTAFNISYSVASLIGMLVSVNFVRLRRMVGGYRNFVMIAVAMFAAGSLIASAASSLWMFYISTALIVIAFGACGSLTMTTIISNWFPGNMGVILGLVLSGTSFGGSFFSPFVSRWIGNAGWRAAYRYEAIIVAVCFVFMLFTLRESPDEAASARRREQQRKAPIDHSIFHDRNFWYIGLGMAFMPIALQALPLNAPLIIQDAGNSVELAGTISSIMFLSCGIGKIFSGWLNDHIGVVKMRNILITSGILGVLALIFANRLPALYLYAVLFGFGQSLALLYLPFHVRYAFPDRDPGDVIGYMNIFTLVGTMVGNPIISYAYELMGSYTPVLIFTAITLFLAGIFAAMVKPGQKRA